MMGISEQAESGLARRIVNARESTDYQTEQVIDDVTEAIVERMAELGLNRRDLADLLGVTPARITRVLRGVNNFTVRTLVEVSRALDCELSVTLVPRDVATPAGYRLSPSATRAAEAAEARSAYRAGGRAPAYASRDNEIRAHLESGKLRVEDEHVLMRHETDGAYRPATFRAAGIHSTKRKTNVGKRAYYLDRILAVARERERRG